MYIKSVTKFRNYIIGFVKYFIITLLLIIFNSNLLNAQLNYKFEYINTENGLPTNAIKGLQFDEKNRFLWVATESGILRYNGHGFQSFADNNITAALNGRIVIFGKTINGELFGKLMDERVFSIHENNAIIEKPVYIMDDENAYLNYKYNLGKTIKAHKAYPIQLRDIKVGENIYVKYEYALYQYRNNQFITIKDTLEFENEFVINNNLFIVKKNGILFKAIIEKNNLSLSQPLNIHTISKTDPNNVFGKVKIFQSNPNDPVYLVTGEKLFILTYNNNSIHFKLITDQLPNKEFIKYVQIDHLTNTIFIGTDNRGIIVGRPQYFKRVLPNNAIDGISSSAYAQLQLSNGNIQINSGQIFGESKIKNENVFYRPSETITFISNDSILFMSNSDGLVEYNLRKNKISNISKEINVYRNSLIQIGNNIYCFNELGVALKKDKWVYIYNHKKMPFNFIVYNLMQINNNEILVATTHGLYKYNLVNNTFKLFYNDNDNSNFRAIYNLNGYYLIGTYGGGVYMFYKDAIKKLPLDQNKYLNYTHCFIEDSKGYVWASTNKGLFMSPKKSLIDFWYKGPGNIKFKYFGKNEGIDQLEMNGGCNPCAIKMRNGNLSFPSIDGLIQFNPNNLQEVNIQPKVYIDKIFIDNQFFILDNFKNELPSSTKNVEIQLGISGMLSQENIMLEYKFDDDSWIRLNVKNPIVNFSNLSYGKHYFSIRLRNTIYDKWQEVEYPFSIKYPWTLNPFMYLIYLLIIFGLVYLYIRFKTIFYKRRQNILENEVFAKTVSLNKLNENLLKRNQAKDHVIAIMNHDILTPLKYLHITAKNIADTTKEDNIKKSITQIAKTSKELEYLTSNMLNWVKFDNIETLANKQSINLYLLVNDLVDFVKPFIQNDNVLILNNVPDDLIIQNWPDSLRVLLYNLIINGVNNTVHGKIEISYNLSNNGYKIIISDTGVGMNDSMVEYLLKGKNKNEVDDIPKLKTGNGVGFQIIRNIVQLMGAKFEIESIQNIGTKVTLIFNDQ